MRLIRSQRGSVIEFAIVFPILLFIIFGGILWGRVTVAQNAVETASRECARTMAIHHDNDMAKSVAKGIIENSLYVGNGPGPVENGPQKPFDGVTDIVISDIGEHYNVTVKYHVPNPTPVLNKLMQAEAKPWGKYISVSSTATFKKELILD